MDGPGASGGGGAPPGRRRYGRRRPEDKAAGPGRPDGESPEGPGSAVAAAPRRLLNALNPFHQQPQTKAPQAPGASQPHNLFTMQEKPRSSFGWRKSKAVSANEPIADDPDGPVTLEIGHLVRDAQNTKSESHQRRAAEVKGTCALLTEAVETSHETYEVVLRTERLVAVTENIGERTAEQLHQDRERLEQTEATLDGLTPMMNKARMEIVAILRELMKDRIFMVLCFLVTCGLIAAVTIFVLKRTRQAENAMTGGTSAPATPTPTAVPPTFAPSTFSPT